MLPTHPTTISRLTTIFRTASESGKWNLRKPMGLRCQCAGELLGSRCIPLLLLSQSQLLPNLVPRGMISERRVHSPPADSPSVGERGCSFETEESEGQLLRSEWVHPCQPGSWHRPTLGTPPDWPSGRKPRRIGMPSDHRPLLWAEIALIDLEQAASSRSFLSRALLIVGLLDDFQRLPAVRASSIARRFDWLRTRIGYS